MKRLFQHDDASLLRADMVVKVENILAALDAAASSRDMDLPGFRLHPLKGGLRGFWSVSVNANWRIVWRFNSQDVEDVDLIDYH